MNRALLCLVLLGCEQAATPPSLDPPPPLPERAAITLAGAELATPLTARLVGLFTSRNPKEQALIVEAPLGSAGANRAVAAGVLDAALVVQVPGDPAPAGVAFAATYPVLVVGAGVRARRISPDALSRTLLGTEPVWANGLARRVLLRGQNDPLQRALASGHRGLADAFSAATEARRWRWIARETDLRAALARTPGALAVMDTGGLSLRGAPVWPLALDGPTPPPVIFWLVPGADPPLRLQRFMSFVTSAEGRGLVRDLGYALPEPR